MKPCLSVLILTGFVVSLGCGDIGGNRRNAGGAVGGAGLVAPDQQVSQPAPAAPQQTQPLPGAPVPAGAPVAGAPGVQIPGGQIPGAAPTAAPQPVMVQEKAQAGVSGKGNYEPGVVTTPIAAYFQTRERVIFEIQIPHAMQLYEADKGYKPKSQEEFMRDIIQVNQIKLPALPPGHKYVYDPQKGELMVEHPQQ